MSEASANSLVRMISQDGWLISNYIQDNSKMVCFYAEVDIIVFQREFTRQ